MARGNNVTCDSITDRLKAGQTMKTPIQPVHGVAEQEIYWLAQHKRAAAMIFLHEASDEDARKY